MEESFPFVQGEGDFKCPYWIKCLLMEKYNINEVRKVIQNFNEGRLHRTQIDDVLMQDIDIEPLTDYEVHILKSQWKKKSIIKVSSDMNDQFEIEIDTDQTDFLTLKRLILNKKPKPFFMDENYPNDSLVKDKKSVMIFFNLDVFDLVIKGYSTQDLKPVSF